MTFYGARPDSWYAVFCQLSFSFAYSIPLFFSPSTQRERTASSPPRQQYLGYRPRRRRSARRRVTQRQHTGDGLFRLQVWRFSFFSSQCCEGSTSVLRRVNLLLYSTWLSWQRLQISQISTPANVRKKIVGTDSAEHSSCRLDSWPSGAEITETEPEPRFSPKAQPNLSKMKNLKP